MMSVMQQTGKFRRVFLFFILYGAMFLFGFVENVKGVSYPLIKAEFNAGDGQQGIMVSVLAMGYVFFCALGGFCISRYGIKPDFLTGFFCMILGLGLAYIMPSLWTTAAALFVVFAGFGLFEVGINALATQIFTRRAALLMNLLHFFYGAGSALSPRAAGVIAAAYSWRFVYLACVPPVLFFFVLALGAKFPAKPEARTDGEKDMSFFDALKNTKVWLFSVVLGLMVVAEMSSTNWGSLYFQDVYDLDPKTSGASFVSTFFIFFTISRLLSGFLIEKIGYMKSLFGAVLAVIGIFVAGFALGKHGIYALPFLGFFVAIFWPTLMAVAMGYFGRHAPIMTSVMIVLGGLLNSGIQLLIGFINEYRGPPWGYRSCLLFACILFAALLLLHRKMSGRSPLV
jgi:fucose permease